MYQDDLLIDGQKLQYHPERTAQWLRDPLNTYPLYVEVSPVGNCNHRCTFCAVDYIGYKMRRLDTEKFKCTLAEMASCEVKSIMYAGEGEPLLHPDIGELINFTKKVGIDVGITTNATPLTKKLVDSSLDSIEWIKVSVNAGNAETYSKVHQTKEDDFKRVWSNIHYACMRKGNTKIGVQAVCLPENIQSLEDLIILARVSGVDYVVIKPYSQHKKSVTKEYEHIQYKEYDKLLRKLELMDTPKCRVIVRRKSMSKWDSQEHGYHKCLSTPYFWAYIMATGDVYGCSAYLLDERFKYGNINDEPFSNIWLGSKRRNSMEYVATKLNIEECRKNCRMDKVNQYLWDMQNTKHKNFI